MFYHYVVNMVEQMWFLTMRLKYYCFEISWFLRIHKLESGQRKRRHIRILRKKLLWQWIQIIQ